jgi:hypothetical protein
MGCRKNQATLTNAEKTAFVNALLALKKTVPSQLHPGDPTMHRYDDYVEVHMNAMMLPNGMNRSPGWAHRAPAFFPWHRVLLYELERDLQKIDPTVTIPYWDWTVNNTNDTSPGSPWTDDFMGALPAGTDQVTTGPFRAGNWTKVVFEMGDNDPDLRRALGRTSFQVAEGSSAVPDLPTPAQVTGALGETPYDTSPWGQGDNPSFRDRLEGWHGAGSIHNRVHLWVGGSMLPSTSPNDPIFFMHHCNIDRLLPVWQAQHPMEGYHPTGMGAELGPLGHNLNDVMIFNDMGQPAPWPDTFTPAQVWNHHDLDYWYDTDPPQITLLTPSLNFTDIPAGVGGTGVTTYRGIEFDVQSCSQVTLEITNGPTAGFAAPSLSVPVPVNAGPLAGLAPNRGRLWISYTSTPMPSNAMGSVTVRAVDSGMGTIFGPWVVNLTANTVPRQTSAVALVLDRSGSMATDAGNGHPRVELLRTAVSTFVDVMQDGDGLGIVRFDNLVDTLMPVQNVGANPGGAGRTQALHIASPTTTIASDPAMTLDPRGSTCIGGGIQAGKAALDAVAGTYTVNAMVVLTDGLENTPPMINMVGGSLTANTFAIGFGQAAAISTNALNAITQSHGGYLVVTGPITQDETFALTEYFLKIQAGIQNSSAVLDPRGNLVFGAKHRIPFILTKADISVDVILLSPAPAYIDFRLEAPDGTIIDPARANAEPTGKFISTPRTSYYRTSLPMLAADIAGTHAGQWHVLLGLNDRAKRADKQLLASINAPSLPYSLLIHAYSNLRFQARLVQASFEPGAMVNVYAAIDQYDVPLETTAVVWAEIRQPDGSNFTMALSKTDPGRFQTSFVAANTGVYTVRVRAQGTTFEGQQFQREQKLTAVVFPGGDKPSPVPVDDRWCKLLSCLFGGHVLGGTFATELSKKGVDLKALEQCLRIHCEGDNPALGGERPYDGPVTVAPKAVATVIQADVHAAEAPTGFATLAEGKAVQRVIGPDRPGPMFDLSPEDKAAQGKMQPTPKFDLSPEDKAAQQKKPKSPDKGKK